MNKFIVLPAICLSTLLISEIAVAATYWDTVIDNAVVVTDTALGNLTARQEKDQINANWREWRRQREDEKISFVGQVGKDGLYPLASYTPADLGTIESLTYFFIDPATGLSTIPAFEVASVDYYALLEPPTLNASEMTETLIRNNLTFIGSSTNAANDFAVDFTLQGFEPIILAFPFDAAGNEIVGEGTAGFASNVLSTPESTSTLTLLALGTLGSTFILKRHKKQNRKTIKVG